MCTIKHNCDISYEQSRKFATKPKILSLDAKLKDEKTRGGISVDLFDYTCLSIHLLVKSAAVRIGIYIYKYLCWVLIIEQRN